MPRSHPVPAKVAATPATLCGRQRKLAGVVVVLTLVGLLTTAARPTHAFARHSLPRQRLRLPAPFGITATTTTTTTTTQLKVSLPLPKRGATPDRDDSAVPTASSSSVSSSTSSSSVSSSLVNPSPLTPGSAAFPKVGILLLNLGGPETLDDVEGFLYNLFADPDIIRLPKPLSPLQPLIAWGISRRRAPQSRAAYASIGGGSPILKYSQQQASLLLQELETRYNITDAACYIGMRYWRPFTEDALAQIRKDKVEALVIVPLYPQFSISTSGSSLRVLQEEFAKNAENAPPVHTVVPSWYDRPGYIQSVADLVSAELNQISDAQVLLQKEETPGLAGKHVLFSAHGVPQSYIAAGDPYQAQMQACVQAIGDVLQERHPDTQIHLSYQSRVGPVEWLRPYTDDVLPELGEQGVRNLVVVPISFVSEHIETLEEIDMEYRELAEESGITNWRRAPALNTHPGFVADLADMVMEALTEPSMTVTEACIANSVGNLVIEDEDGSSLGRSLYNTAGVQNVVGAEEMARVQPNDTSLAIGTLATFIAFAFLAVNVLAL